MSAFDAIVVGSGITGGWVAKELCERGLKVMVLDRGKKIVAGEDYSDLLSPWELENFDQLPEAEAAERYGRITEAIGLRSYLRNSNKHFFGREDESPYEVASDSGFALVQAYSSGGKSLVWSRQTYRFGEIDFEANKADGVGVDWPLRYEDLRPWYERVEKFAGISGSVENLPQLPDSIFQPPFELNCAEKVLKQKVEARFPHRRVIPARCAHLTNPTAEQLELGRGKCQVRNQCHRGCSFGAYFSSVSATLPAAKKTGRLEQREYAIVHSLEYDPTSRRVTGVRVIDARDRSRSVMQAPIVFLCASTVATTVILLNSTSERYPEGLGNDSRQLGLNLMDHVGGARATGRLPGMEDRYYSGRRPVGFYVPRYRNFLEGGSGFSRGFAFQGMAWRDGWTGDRPGIGEAFKTSNRQPGPWRVSMWAMGEMLPRSENRITLHSSKKDKWGIPIPIFHIGSRQNELKMMQQAADDARDMLASAGCVEIETRRPVEESQLSVPGSKVHEMGTARMGYDPKTSVLNGYNQVHGIANLFVADGACMPSSPSQNPSLTYMALAARAAHQAADLFVAGRL